MLLNPIAEKISGKNLKNRNIAIIGDAGVGKSSFLNNYFGLNLKQENSSKGVTTWVDVKPIKIKDTNLTVFDIPGYEIDSVIENSPDLDLICYLSKLVVLPKIDCICFIMKADRKDKIKNIDLFKSFLGEKGTEYVILINGCEENIFNGVEWLEIPDNVEIKNKFLSFKQYNNLHEISSSFLILGNTIIKEKIEKKCGDIADSILTCDSSGITSKIVNVISKIKDGVVSELFEEAFVAYHRKKPVWENIFKFIPVLNIIPAIKDYLAERKILNQQVEEVNKEGVGKALNIVKQNSDTNIKEKDYLSKFNEIDTEFKKIKIKKLGK